MDLGANYLLAVNENQGQLYQEVRDIFEAGSRLAWMAWPTTMPPP